MITIARLIWDSWNVVHIARHKVTPEEVEQVCVGNPYQDYGHTERIRLIGPTSTGRMLSIVLAAKGQNIYYPVTARPASRKERRYYEEIYKNEGGGIS